MGSLSKEKGGSSSMAEQVIVGLVVGLVVAVASSVFDRWIEHRWPND